MGRGRVMPLSVLILSVLTCAEGTSHEKNEMGWSSSKPPTDPVCEVDGRFMVGYRHAIPGSDVELDMQAIPGGDFLMGSPTDEAGRRADEGPQVKVHIEPFWIGRHEVTWAEYGLFMKLCDVFEKFNDLGIRQVDEENQGDAVTAPSKLYEPSFTFETGEDPNQPAVSMSQYAAKQYTKWLSLLTGQFYRLPTEAEWEYACRAGSTTAYSFGDHAGQLIQYGWSVDSTDWVTSKVGQKKPNAWGLFDMHGNVCEWTLDQYAADHYAAISVSEQPTPAVTVTRAINWPTKLFPRVLRGGSWDSEPADCRSAARMASDDDEWRSFDPNTPKSPWWFASDFGQTVGFRIVRPVHPVTADSMRKQFWDADVDQIQAHADRRIDKEGRGERGLVDPELPNAIQELRATSTP